MTVYIIAQMKIHDRAGYDRYDAGFMEIFEKYDGVLLSVDEAPRVLEGDFPATRSILIEFPSEESAFAWMTSAEYQELAKHRLDAATGSAIMVQKLDDAGVEALRAKSTSR